MGANYFMTFKNPFGKSKSMEMNQNSHHSDGLALRKKAHIELAARSVTSVSEMDTRFYYEPLFFTHPAKDQKLNHQFLGHEMDYPFWISSMTGGTLHAKHINQNLAELCGKYKLGMGLGSCRPLLEGVERKEDFAVRKYLGAQPLFANLGIAQVEELSGNEDKIHEMVKSLEADGLMIHLNPLQEWFQPEGDRFKVSPLETIKRFLETAKYQVIVKEVGQGMGPKSLKALLDLPLAGIEFGAFGGTNFSRLESLRGESLEAKAPFIQVGHSASEMVEFLNILPTQNKEFIISGGVSGVLDGFELMKKLKAPSVIGMAQAYLNPAMESFESLEKYFLSQKEALLVAEGILALKGE